MKKCKHCGQEFDNHHKYANHIRWKHKGQDYYDSFKNKMSEMTTNYYKNKFGEIKEFEVICNNCGKSFKIKERETKRKNKYFCSRSCANTRHHSQSTIDKIKKGNLKKWSDENFKKENIQISINNLSKNSRFSSRGEREIRKILKGIFGNKNVSSHRLVKLENGKYKAVDIHIKMYNTIIEYDGEWHFNPSLYEKIKTKETTFFSVVEKDLLLKKYCKINNIKLLRVSDDKYKKEKIIMINKILNFIKDPNNMYLEMY